MATMRMTTDPTASGDKDYFHFDVGDGVYRRDDKHDGFHLSAWMMPEDAAELVRRWNAPAEIIRLKSGIAAIVAEETLQMRAEIERLLADSDPPVCRLQFPDGNVPGNAREAAEGWKREYDHLRVINAGLLAALQTLVDPAERDMKANQGGDDHEGEPESSGGWWSTSTARAIVEARSAIAKATKPGEEQ